MNFAQAIARKNWKNETKSEKEFDKKQQKLYCEAVKRYCNLFIGKVETSVISQTPHTIKILVVTKSTGYRRIAKVNKINFNIQMEKDPSYVKAV